MGTIVKVIAGVLTSKVVWHYFGADIIGAIDRVRASVTPDKKESTVNEEVKQ